MQIKREWFFDVFNALRQNHQISTTHPSLKDYYERSHIVAILEEAGLINIIDINPIAFKGKAELGELDKLEYSDKQLWKILQNKVP